MVHKVIITKNGNNSLKSLFLLLINQQVTTSVKGFLRLLWSRITLIQRLLSAFQSDISLLFTRAGTGLLCELHCVSKETNIAQ